ncbi:conserved exported hypothetical protein [Sphingomonas sp. EC-HK361]|uniref:DUF3576 domain-containing protein n=1 Tax=Sphingomonas sp. EC-HK361 TaxID=2038397 RepID=UPI001251097F|nr:DUF3576 domain-containing protein [Sphingomonas sp. EC-HK361]VVT20861.1 conserved exported hypothetical protein [Sphingomonas sp. EC-HK361]
MLRPLRTAFAVAAVLGLTACGGGNARPKADLAASKITTIGVNSYLWRASLDTLSFMPLLQADSNGGVIVTDWYVNPQVPTERMKVTVSILDQDLRADALRVAALRQVNQGGQWVAAPVQAATTQKLENIILTKARDLRQASITE